MSHYDATNKSTLQAVHAIKPPKSTKIIHVTTVTRINKKKKKNTEHYKPGLTKKDERELYFFAQSKNNHHSVNQRTIMNLCIKI